MADRLQQQQQQSSNPPGASSREPASASGSQPYQPLLRFILVGDLSVGKTCLLRQFIHHDFSEKTTTTIGVDFDMLSCKVNGRNVKIQVWDTAGHEKFRTITSNYYKSADVVLLVFSLTDEKTFCDVSFWLEQVEMNAKEGVYRVLLGNKCDVEHQRKIDQETARKFAEEKDIEYMEVSARTGHNVQEAFMKVASEMERRKHKMCEPAADSIHLDEDSPGGTGKKHAAGCCGGAKDRTAAIV